MIDDYKNIVKELKSTNDERKKKDTEIQCVIIQEKESVNVETQCYYLEHKSRCHHLSAIPMKAFWTNQIELCNKRRDTVLVFVS